MIPAACVYVHRRHVDHLAGRRERIRTDCGIFGARRTSIPESWQPLI